MNKFNGYSRLLVLLTLILVLCYNLYNIPDEIGPLKFKKVDFFADLRIPHNNFDFTKSLADLDEPEEQSINNNYSSFSFTEQDKKLRDSLYIQFKNKIINNRYLIEDNSTGKTSLVRFFNALDNVDNLDRPVRIAFFGDSFIEGDVIVADFRELVQNRFGGKGVGFIPVISPVGDFRKTIKQRQEGWNIRSIQKEMSRDYPFSGMTFTPETATCNIKINSTDNFANTYPFSSVKLIYDKNHNAQIELIPGKGDIIKTDLNQTASVNQKECGKKRNSNISESVPL